MTDQQPSFTRGIFAGAIHDSLLFPYPDPLDRRDPDEARIVRRLCADLRALQRDGTIDSARFDEDETIPEEVIRAFARLGMLALNIPTEYGGLGLSATAYARVFSTLSRIDPSLAVMVGVHCGLGAKAIVLYGSTEQKARYLPPLARGEFLAAYALTEPETGSDAQNIVTRAAPGADGGWILDGRKIWIGNGHRAGVIVTFAQTAIERRGEMVNRPTAFLIRPDMPGFRVAGTVRKLGIRGSTQAELVYEGLRMPGDHVLGHIGKGFAVAVNVLNGGRLTLAAGCTGGAKRIIGEMAEYSETRVQFGQPLAAFEITQRKVAQLASEVYASDAMLGHLAATIDRGDTDYSLEAACAKVFASELIWRAADEMVQVAGGRGFVKPYPFERMLRDARINAIPPDRDILFCPDMFLGAHVRRVTGRENIHVWMGECHVHAGIDPEHISLQRRLHPSAEFLIHPECGCASSAIEAMSAGAIDPTGVQILSTEGMIKRPALSDADEFIVATEVGILHRLRRENPTKTFFAASERAQCAYMKVTTLPKVYRALQELQHEITVPPEIASRARLAIERMVAIGGGAGPSLSPAPALMTDPGE